MQKTKNIYYIYNPFLLSTSFYSVFAQTEKSWDGGKVAEENNLFIDQVEKMQNEIERIINLIGDTEKYCNSKGCWSNINGGQILKYEGIQGVWTSDNSGQIIINKDKNGFSWEDSNHGQILAYSDGSKMKWTSDNHGQVLKYEDGNGNSWESDNNGQILKYEGVQGKWTSENNGQVLEYEDGSKKWDSVNDGQVTDYQDVQGNEWNENDLIKDYLPKDLIKN